MRVKQKKENLVASNKESAAVAAANATGRWQLRIALISAIVAIISSLATVYATSSKLRDASGQLDESIKQAGAVAKLARPLVPIGTVIPSLLPPEKFENVMGSLQDSAAESVWVLADGREVRGSTYAKLTGDSNVPNLQEYSIVDTRIYTGDIRHGESLLAAIPANDRNRPWSWSVSLREADPTTPFGEYEQRMQRILVSADDPSHVKATATIFDGKHKRFAPDTPASVNYLGISVVSQKLYWYVKVNDG